MLKRKSSLPMKTNELGEPLCHRCYGPVTRHDDADSVVCFHCVARKRAEYEADPEYAAEMKRINTPSSHPYRMFKFFVRAHFGKAKKRKFINSATDYYIEATLKGVTKRRKKFIGVK